MIVGLVGAGNLISANGWTGVDVLGVGTNNTWVTANFIGTDVTGTQDLGNAIHGVAVFAQADDTRIGTNSDGVNDAAEFNLISGNDGSGVGIWDSGTDRTVVAGNLIGTAIRRLPGPM